MSFLKHLNHQEKLRVTESRLTDLRNQTQQLRQELKVAHKVSILSQNELARHCNTRKTLSDL